MPHVLIVDDDTESCRTISKLADSEGCTVVAAHDLRRARIELARRRPDILLADLSLPDGTGLELVGDRAMRRRISEVVLTTAHASVDTAIEALRNGASDYLIKPINESRLRAILARVLRSVDAGARAGATHDDAADPGHFGHMLGRSASMQAVYEKIARVAPTEAAVLLVGETGTGKELAAHTLHDMSARAANPFVAVNCAAIAAGQFDAEMFGDGSGAGANEAPRQGHFERAEGGTLFLDEITEIGLDLQTKLLRILETGRYTRTGSDQESDANVRVIAATNEDPQKAVDEGKLRADLYHLLNVFPVYLPPLRERKGDVGLLARHFFGELNVTHSTSKRFPSGLVERLNRHRWSGNVRELRSFLYRAYILCDDVLDAAALEIPSAPEERSSARAAIEIPVGTSLADADRQLILATLAECGGVKKHCAKLLGISLKTLYNRLDDYGLGRNRSALVAAAKSSDPGASLN